MFVSLDLETTGTNPENDKILEFGATKFDLNGNAENLTFLFNPGIPIPPIITHITNIRDEDVKNAAIYEDKIREIIDFIGELPIIGHNIRFDTGFLRANGVAIENNPEFDTFELASMLIADAPSYSLEILSHELNLQHVEKHRALDDAIAAKELFLVLLDKYSALPTPLFNKCQDILKKSDWPLKEVLLTLKNQPKALTKKEKTVQEAISIIQIPQDAELIETDLDYEIIIQSLIQSEEKSSYIALPSELFEKVARKNEAINKLDIAENYLSPTRLEKFIQKKHFSDAETGALLKILIWRERTSSGLLRELNFVGEEKNLRQRINVNPELCNLEKEEYFNKAKNVGSKQITICTHNFVMENEETLEKLIIIDFDAFSRKIFSVNSIFQNSNKFNAPLFQLKEKYPENPIVESLIAKSEILFGIFGIIFDKYAKHDEYSSRCDITSAIANVKEWQEVKDLSHNLIEISKELAELNVEDNLAELKFWKQNLIELKELLNLNNLPEYLTLIETDQNEQPYLKKLPTTLQQHCQKTFNHYRKIQIIDEALNAGDDGRFIKQFHGLPREYKLANLKTAKNLNIVLAKEQQAPLPILEYYINEKQGKTAIIAGSKRQLEFYTLKLSQKYKEQGTRIISQLTGSIGKINSQFKQKPENAILMVTPGNWLNLNCTNLIQTVIIEKLPFDSPNSHFIFALSQQFQNSFIDFQLPRTILNIKKILNRLPENSEVIILDPRTHNRKYSENIYKALCEFGPVQIGSL